MEALVDLVNVASPRARPRRRAPVAAAAAELLARYTHRHPEARGDAAARGAAFFIASAYDSMTRGDAPPLPAYGHSALRHVGGDAAQLSAAIAGILEELGGGGVLLYVLQKHLGSRAVLAWDSAISALTAHAAHAPEGGRPLDWREVADVCEGVKTLEDCPTCCAARGGPRARAAPLPTGPAWDLLVALHNEIGARQAPAARPAAAPAVVRCAHEIWEAYRARAPSDDPAVVAAAYLLARAGRDAEVPETLAGPLLQLTGGSLEALGAAADAVSGALAPQLPRILLSHESPAVMPYDEAVRRFYSERVARGEHGAANLTPGSAGAARVHDIWHGVIAVT